MARSDAYKNTAETPVKRYLKWSSSNKCFTYYDKEKNDNVKVALPLTLVHFDEYATIKGFDDKSQSSIYSNEVKSTKIESLSVRSFKGGELINGLYTSIKDRIAALGGSYHLSLYAMIGEDIVNISIKGDALRSWSDFAKENRKAFLSSFITIPSATDEKKGSVKYSNPVFKLGAPIPADVSTKADASYDELMQYFRDRKAGAQVIVEPEVQSQESNIPKFAKEPIAEAADYSDIPF